MFVMRWLRRKLHREERGQMLILFMVGTMVFLAVAVIGIDVTLWHSQRRTAQKDSDAVALAGGQELLNRTTALDITSRAQASAQTWATRNGIDSSYFTNSTPNVISSCFGSPPFDGKPDGLSVDLSKQGTTLFAQIWDVVAPDVGAHAKVCVGSPPDAEGILPFGISVVTSQCFLPDGTPKFGSTCDVEVRAPDGQSGETGTLKLYNDGSLNCSASNVGQTNTTLEAQVADGANTTCAIAPANANAASCQIFNVDNIGSCVWSDTGNRANTVVDGLQLRLSHEGKTAAPNNCDDRYPDSFFGAGNVKDKVDQWWEALFPVGRDIHNVTPGPSVFFEKRDCAAPRLVTLILIDQFAALGQGPYLIKGFAGFFITGCRDDGADGISGTADDVFNSRCVTGNCKINRVTCPNPKNEPTLQDTGHLKLEGMFINYIDVGKRGGALTKFGRVQLFLVE